MFIAKYELEGKQYNYIYSDNWDGWREYHKDTFSPEVKNVGILLLKVSGRTYKERKEFVIELAKDWQLNFSSLDWSYNELAIIQNYFEKIALKYGLTKEFKENCII